MKPNSFATGFLAGALIGFLGIAVTILGTSNRMMILEDRLSRLVDMNDAKQRQIHELRSVNEHLEQNQDYEFMQEQRLVNLAESKQIAEAFTSFDGEVTQYKNEELGFTMSYPAAWGKLSISINTPDTMERIESGKLVSGRFSHKNISFGAYSADYQDIGRGFTTAEAIFATSNPEAGNPAMDQAKPDDIRILESGAKVYMWYAWEVGWDTGETVFGIKVPLLHPDIPALGIAGPISNDVLTEEEIAGFLEMARTFELIR